MQEEDWRTQAQYWFDLHHKLARSFDPDLANYYSDSAYLQRTLIRKDGTQQHRAMPGLMYKEAIRNLMGLAKQLNDINDIADLVYCNAQTLRMRVCHSVHSKAQREGNGFPLFKGCNAAVDRMTSSRRGDNQSGRHAPTRVYSPAYIP